MSELKECPFCGGTAGLVETDQIEHNSWSARIECRDCVASVSTQYTEPSPELAIARVEELWNRRATPADHISQARDAPIGYVNAQWAADRKGTAKVYPEPHPRLATFPLFAANSPAASFPKDEPLNCGCETCRPITLTDMRMIVCATCGNKRCPHATDHRNACTYSNEPGQTGSSYAAPPEKPAGDVTDI